jgi:hypothetical protein
VDLIYSLWELIPRRVSDKRDRSGKPKLIDRNNLPDAIARLLPLKLPIN